MKSDGRKRSKILLVTPPYHAGVVESAGVWMNVGFVYVAGALRARGHDVAIYDAMSYWHDADRVQQEIARQDPDVIGLTAVTASFPACVEVARRAKEAKPELITVLGNVHPTFMWRDVLEQHPFIDYVVRGEGEQTMGELADCLVAGADAADLAKIDGLAWRRDGQPYSNRRRPLFRELDQLERAWDLVDWPTYTYRPRPGSTLAVVSSSRGCTQECAFCSQQLFWQRNWRPMSPEAFVAQMEHLRDHFGVSVAMLSDETPTTQRDRWERILDLLIERQVGVELLMETRVDDILRDADILERYRLAGVSHIYVGVEAARQDNLDLWKKDTTVEQGRTAIQLINQADIVSETSFVMGMPDETQESLAATVEMAKHFAPDLAFFLAITPWPYAQLYPELRDHVEVFDFARYNLVEAVIKPDAMTIDEVTAGLGRASHQFYADKFINRFETLTPFKQEVMIKVMNILMNHSYLKRDMERLRGEMPEWVRKLLERMEAAEAQAKTIPSLGTVAEPPNPP